MSEKNVTKADQSEARARAGRIRAGIQSYLSTLADVAAAYAERDWVTLGYKDWSDYVDTEFSETRLRLTPEHRQKAVQELRLAGMSQRAIGSALGVAQDTVRRDLEVNDSVHLKEVRGADGKTYAAQRDPIPPQIAEEIERRIAQRVHPHPAERSAAQSEANGRPGAGFDHPHGGEAHAELGVAVPLPRGDVEVDGIAQPPAGAEETAGTASSIPTPAERNSAGVGDTLDDPEAIERQRREGSSLAVVKALVALRMCLDPDPVRWLTDTYIPGLYRERDLPVVRDAFTPGGLREAAKYLDLLADHLDAHGREL